MIVAFRADASFQIGTGHIMRCLTLADVLRAHGAECIFLSRDHPGHLHHMIEAVGYQLLRLGPVDQAFNSYGSIPDYSSWLGVDWQRDARDTWDHIACLGVDWLVVDHYGLDSNWEIALSQVCGRVMAIDDLANRNHMVDALLDQSLDRIPKDYESKAPLSCKLMLGSNYALLRPEFSALRSESIARRKHGQLRKLLITMGGVDQQNFTGAVLDAIGSWGLSASLDVKIVIGPNFPWAELVAEQAKKLPFSAEVLVNVKSMGALMCESDLAIGAAGSTSWERCCLGLPTLQLVLADNQQGIANALNHIGAAYLLEQNDLRSNLTSAMDQLFRNPELLLTMSNIAAQQVDGHGAGRVAQYLLKGH